MILIRRSILLFSLTLLVTIPSFAASSLCDAMAGNLVLNCGFETGDFTDWTVTLNTGFSSVTPNAPFVNSGTFGAQLGPVGADGSLTQVIADTAGTVSLDFWLLNDSSGTNDFTVEWNGVVVPTTDTPFVDAGAFPYTEEGPVTLASTGSDTLQFFYRQDPSYLGLDDISVVQLTTATTPEPGSILLLITVVGLCGMAFKKRSARNAD
jgi:hypothetical protein